MREIKFRAWDKENKLMLPVNKIDYDNGRQLLFIVNINGGEKIIDFDFKTNSFPVMQYIGLKDKNGKDIYEGDIVKTGNIISFIKYYEEYAKFVNVEVETVKNISDIGINMDCLSKDHLKMIVIGNIYENFELLNLDLDIETIECLFNKFN